MRVIDAGVVIDFLIGGLDPRVVRGAGAAVPHLLDNEVTHVLRRLVHRGDLSEDDGWRAMEGFMRLSLSRWSVADLRPRIWELRHNVSGYDATYVALAEALGVPLVTTDQKLAGAPGLRCRVEVV